MATLTARAKDGEVSIEIASDESSESAAARLAAAVIAAGGPVPRDLTPGEQMMATLIRGGHDRVLVYMQLEQCKRAQRIQRGEFETMEQR